MRKRACQISLLAFIAIQWCTLALSQEQPGNAEIINLFRVATLYVEGQDSASVSASAAADTVRISPGSTRSFTVTTSGCPASSYNVQTDLPSFITFTDKGVTRNITTNQFTIKFDLTVSSSAPAGLHNVTLTYRFLTGSIVLCTRELTYVVDTRTIAAPTANFTGSPRSGPSPLTVQFTSTSTGQITSYSWNFGDGQTSTAANPSHTYVNAGTYTISLTVTGPGGSNTKTRANYITVTATAPVAEFTGSPTSGERPLTVQFTDASTGQITSRSWNFGDGQTSTATNPAHTYVNAGTYTVSLTVTGPGGSNTKTRTNYITVTQPAAPVADFTGSPTSGERPLTVQFTDASSGQITSRSWNFGDGQTSTSTNPSHTYSNVGTYTVSLTVTGPGGSNTKTRENYITVRPSNNPPVVANAIPDTTLTVGDAAFTRDLSAPPVVFADPDGDVLSYAVSSSNPSVANAVMSGSVLTVSPGAVGNTTITITADDGKGGMASDTFTVQVTPANTYCSQDVPKSIPDPGTATSTLTIDKDLIIGDLNVRLFINHSFDSDLDLSLISPSGTKVELFTDVGGSGDHFGSTCSPLPNCLIDDQATSNITSGSAPFVGSFQSEGLTLGVFNGENAKGTWTLMLEDDDSGASGKLNCWCLEIEPAPSKDVGITAIDLPKLVLLGNSVPVNVVIKNFGAEAQSDFPVSYSINDEPAVTENFTGTLQTGTSATKTFSGQWTPGAEGTYRFTAWTMLSGDARSDNDTLATPKEVVVRESNAVPLMAEIGSQTVRAGITKRLSLFAIDADGDSMTFNIPNNPGFLSISGFSQNGDTATATLVISPSRHLTGSFNASVEVKDKFDAATFIAFTVQVVPRVLNSPTNLTASLSQTQKTVTLNWEAPAIAENSLFAGIWMGNTSQNLPVYMNVADDGFIDSLVVRLRLNFINFTCTINYIRNALVEVKNDTFDAFLGVPITNVSTTLHGTFSSDTTVGGTYDGFSGSYFIICGSTVSFGTGGTQLSAGTWQARKTAPGSGTQPPVLQAYHIYRSLQPNAKATGSLIGSTDANTKTFIESNLNDATYFYQVTGVYDLGESDPSNEASILITGVQDRIVELPIEYALEQNYPNPFNPETEIRFQLPKSGYVVLKIFNTLGAEIRTLVDAPYRPGYHHARWDGEDNNGKPVASGVYFYRLQAGNFSQVKKMSLLR